MVVLFDLRFNSTKNFQMWNPELLPDTAEVYDSEHPVYKSEGEYAWLKLRIGGQMSDCPSQFFDTEYILSLPTEPAPIASGAANLVLANLSSKPNIKRKQDLLTISPTDDGGLAKKHEDE